MSSPAMDGLIYDIEKGIAIFQPPFYFTEMVFRRFSG
jgi:hypothetical protein